VKCGHGRQRAFIILLEEREKKGWKSCKLEMHKALSFLQLTFSKGYKVLPSHKSLRGFSMKGVDGSSLAVENKVLAEVVSMRTYAEALVGLGQYPASAIVQRVSGVDFKI
jgi:hypothetical protein